MNSRNSYLRHTFLLFLFSVVSLILVMISFQFFFLRQSEAIHQAAVLDRELQKAEQVLSIADQMLEIAESSRVENQAAEREMVERLKTKMNLLKSQETGASIDKIASLVFSATERSLGKMDSKRLTTQIALERENLAEVVGQSALANRDRLTLLYADLEGRRFHPLIFSLILSLVLVVALIFGSSLSLSRLRRFVKVMNRLTNSVSQGDLGARGFLDRKDEFSNIVESFNGMVAQLKASQSDLARSNQDLENFAFMISHDLQTPMRHILAFSANLKSSSTADIEAVKTIRRSAERLLVLVDSLLEFSRVRPEGLEIESVDLKSAIGPLITELRSLNKNFSVRFEAEFVSPVRAFRPLLLMVFQNLFENSIKYYRGDSAPEVVLSLVEYPQNWELRISDNGPGIPEDQWERVFRIFRRLDREAGVSGHGIGLSLCQRIIRWHGGDIDIVPSVNGTTMRLTISKNI